MTTELVISPVISWREISYSRRSAIRAFLKELALQIKLYRKAFRQSQSNQTKYQHSDGVITGYPGHPLATTVLVPDTFDGLPITHKIRNVIPIKLLMDSINIDSVYSLYRHLHVATSMARGKTLLQIEPVCKDGKHKCPSLDPEMLAWANSVLLGKAPLTVVVHPSLTPGQRIAQAVHAVVAFQHKFPSVPWLNDTILIKTSDLDQFEYLRRKSTYIIGVSEHYSDVDLPLGITAFAYYGPRTWALPLA